MYSLYLFCNPWQLVAGLQEQDNEENSTLTELRRDNTRLFTDSATYICGKKDKIFK